MNEDSFDVGITKVLNHEAVTVNSVFHFSADLQEDIISSCCNWIQFDSSETASLKLEEHVNGIASFHVIMRNVLLIGERLSSVDQTDHGNIDSLLFLKGLLDLQNGVCRLEVERLFDSSERLESQKRS